MDRRYYNADSLERACGVFERLYGLSSEDFYTAHTHGEEVGSISRFHRHVWAGFYRDCLRIRGRDGDFAADVEKLLSPV